MLVWKKSDPTRQTVSSLVLILPMLLWCSTANSTTAAAIIVDYARGTLSEGMYLVNARILYGLSKETQDALDHGISLQFDIDLETLLQREWLWDKTIATSSLRYRLEHHPLSGHYQVTNLNNFHRRQFQSLEGALNYLSVIDDHPLLMHDVLSPDKIYVARIRARLNIDALPAPLRLLAYVSPKWRLASPWYEWLIQQ